MFDTNAVNQTESNGSVPDIIPLGQKAENWTKQRSFLKEKHQLETVLGPSNINWFDELTERALLARKECFKQQVPVFDSPVSSPTVSQLIKNHIQVGQSPPGFYHSSPAIVGKYLHDVSPLSTPDSRGLWHRPSLGISPVLKDGPFNQSSSHAVPNLGLCNDDSTFSWTNSLATPPRLEDPSNESTGETQTKPKDPVRALFSPSNRLDTTGDSIEVLDSTYETENDESVNNNENECRVGHYSHLPCEVGSIYLKNILPDKKVMDSWRDTFRKKLIVKSDSFGKNHSIDSSPSTVRCGNYENSPSELFIGSDYAERDKPESCRDRHSVGNTGDSSQSFNPVSKLELQHSARSRSMTPTEDEKNNEGCLSPVFPKPVSSRKKGKMSSDVKRKREITNSSVVEALSDFFDPPSGAVGKRHTPGLKRKSSELCDGDFKQDVNMNKQSFSTPKNAVSLNSILIKEKQSHSSSAKKVRFSDSVVKYSEERRTNGSHTKRRKKNQKIRTSSNGDKDRAKSENCINKEKNLLQQEVNDKFDSSAILLENKRTDVYTGKNQEIFGQAKECEEVFSQVSATALEEMCEAAVNSSAIDNSKTAYKECLPGNSGDSSKTIPKTVTLQHTNTKPKRFMYPSKQQIVVASPGEIFKFREDEKGDAKAKGIVMAIHTNNIITVKDSDSNKKDCKLQDTNIEAAVSEKSGVEMNANSRQMKNAVQQECAHVPSISDSGYRDSTSTNQMEDMFPDGFKTSIGFQSASGKCIDLSEVAVAKAKTLFKEEHQSLVADDKVNIMVRDNIEHTSINIDSRYEVAEDVKPSEDMLQREEMQFTEWCEDFDMDQMEIGVACSVDGNAKSCVPQITDEIVQEQKNRFKKQENIMKSEKKVPKVQIIAKEIQHNDSFDTVNENKENGIKRKDVSERKVGHTKTESASEMLEEPLFSNSITPYSCLKEVEPQCKGFTTASGIILKFDEEKLKKAQKLLTVSEESSDETSNVIFTSDETYLDVKTIGQVPTCKPISFENDHATIKTQEFSGFATASGKCLKLSATAVKKAETLLEERNKETDTSVNEIVNMNQNNRPLPCRNPSLPLHETFKEELGVGKLAQFGSDSSLNNDLEILKTMKANVKRNVNEVVQPKVNKPNPIKLSDKSSKPQGFRPFKAPKRIPLNSELKTPAVISNATNRTRVNLTERPVLHPETRLKSHVNDKNNLKKECKQSTNYINPINKQENKPIETENNLTSVPIMEKDNHEYFQTDVCDGIFTQMFADDMELDDEPCLDSKKAEKHKDDISCQPDIGATSDDALEKARKSFQENNEDPISDDKKILLQRHFDNVNKKAIKEAKEHLIEDLEASVDTKTCQPQFQTTYRANASISKCAFNEMTKPLDELEEDTICSKKSSNISGEDIDKRKGKASVLSSESNDENICDPHSTLLKNKLPFTGQHLKGFCTASGSSVNISQSALNKARELFTDSEGSLAERLHTCVDSISVLQTTVGNNEGNIPQMENERVILSRLNENQIVDVDQHRNLLKVEGFQTASGAHVTVSAKALETARNTLKDADDIASIKDNPLFKGFQNASRTHVTVSETALETAGNSLKDDMGCFDRLDKPKFASGTNVHVSDKALESAWDTLKDIKEDKPFFKGFQTASRTHVKLTDKALELAKKSLRDAGDSDSSDKPQFKGFQTARGSHVTISDKALENAGKTLKDADDIDNSEKLQFKGLQTASGTNFNISDKALEMARNTLKDAEDIDNSIKPQFKGFQTASGTHINLSDKALEMGKKTLKDADDIDNSDTPQFKGFQTARGTNVTISDKALEIARSTLKGVGDIGNSEVPQFKGFQTASGSHVNISDKALEKAKKTLKDADDIDNSDKPKIKGFQTASGTNVNISDKALEMARKTLKDAGDINYSDRPQFKGFQTASGTHVNISDKALKKARNSLKDADDIDNSDKPQFKGFQTASGMSINVSDKALEMARNSLKDTDAIDNSDKPQFKGFQTASGTHVNISDKALKKARNSLKDVDDIDNSDKPQFKGFQTASSMSVNVSDKALEMARNSLKDTDAIDNSDKPQFKGFQNASGTQVNISDKALKKARNSLKDADDIDNSDKPQFKGFQTASGTSVNVSDKALKMARNSLKDTEAIDNFDKPQFKGFQTASGTNVSLSDKALEMARNTLKDADDINYSDKPKFKGFQTAGGTNVNISDKALEMARISLKDADDFNYSAKPKFKGFQTAGGTNVNISNEALEMARNTLKDVDGKSLEGDEKILKDIKDMDDLDVPLIKRFQTASGTHVIVSDRAFETARNSVSDQISLMLAPQHPRKVMEEHDANEEIMDSADLSEVGESEVGNLTDVELPFKRQKLGPSTERGIMHMSAVKADSLVKRKPLRSAPEGQTTDRRHPGFRPFKPVRSRNIEKQAPRKEHPTITPSTEAKSSFQTPYKKHDLSKATSDPFPESMAEISKKAPVFHSRLKSRLPSPVDRDAVESETPKPYDCSTGITLRDRSMTVVPHNHSIHSVCDNSELPSDCCVTKQLQNLPKSKVHKNEDLPVKDSVEKSTDQTDVSMETLDLGSMSQDEDDMYYCNLVEARRRQDQIISSRQSQKVEPVSGRWYQTKIAGLDKKVKLRQVVTKQINQGNGKQILVTSLTAEDFRFSLIDHYGSHTAHVLLGDGALLVPDNEEKAGKKEFYRAFLTMNGVDARLVNDAWIYNHYRWIVWKLAAYEVTCASLYGRSLTPENVMLQLKYRYDREIDRAERSCLKRIYERDDAASKRLVLCVSVVTFNNGPSNSESRTNLKQELTKVDVELTDGWYKVPAQLDGPLTSLVETGRIRPGHKFCISGAELVGSEDACAPLEAPASVHLKINMNSTRPAAWDCLLGYQKDPRPLCIPLISLYDEGGIVGVVDVVLVRKYPIMYMEKVTGGGCVFRSGRDEERAQQQYQTRRQVELEKLYNQIQLEIEKEQRQDQKQRRGSKKYSNIEIEQLMTGDEIHEAIENAAQPDNIQNYLSETQQGLLYDYQRCLQDEKQQELNTRVQSALRDREDEAPMERNVTPVLKFRIAGCSNKDLDSQTTTILTVWRPASEISDLQEGKRYKIYSLNTSSASEALCEKEVSGLERMLCSIGWEIPGCMDWCTVCHDITALSKYIGSNVQVTATKQTKFMHMDIDENLLDRIYEPREVLWVSDIKRRQAPYGEFDFVGYIVKTVPAGMTEGVRNPDMVYLADCQSNILCVKFWNGLKIFGEDLFVEGSCLCMSNLMDKSSFRNKSLPAVEATTEFTTITQKPQNSRQRQALEKLHSLIKSKDNFKDDVLAALDDLLQNRRLAYTPEKHQRPIQAVSSNQNTSLSSSKKEIMAADSTKVKHDIQQGEAEHYKVADTHTLITKDNVNVLDESVTGTPSSQSRQKNNLSRLAKLSAYGTPDCISPLPVAVPRSVSRGFKPPAFRKKLN